MYAQCVQTYGVNWVVAKYATDEPLRPGAQFKTGNVADNTTGCDDCVYTGSAVNGDTSGAIAMNYKASVVHDIATKNLELLEEGNAYNTPSHGVLQFPLIFEQQPFLNAIDLFIANGADLSQVADEVYLITMEGSKYILENNADYHAWFDAMFSRARTINNDTANLLNDLTNASNTSVAMSAIAAANNART